MYTSDQIRLAATSAAEQTVANLSKFPNNIITQQELFTMAGIHPPPETCTHDEYDQWNLQKMSFRRQWCETMLELTGRWPATVRGEGFRLLLPEQNIDYAEITVLKKIARSVAKGLSIVRGTRNTDLDDSGLRQKINAELRFAAVSNAAQAADHQAAQERTFRASPNQTRSPLPPPTQPLDTTNE